VEVAAAVEVAVVWYCLMCGVGRGAAAAALHICVFIVGICGEADYEGVGACFADCGGHGCWCAGRGEVLWVV